LEKVFGLDGRFGFTPVGFIGSDDGETGKTEVGHGAGSGADIERITRRDEDNGDAIALRGGEQAMIVERAPAGWYTAKASWRPAGRMTLGRESLELEVEKLCATARWCYTRGWAAATSGNFSVRVSDGRTQRIIITPSGLDKGIVTAAHLLEIDGEGQVLKGNGKPSAETDLHLVIYGARPESGAVLHVHTVWNTLISGRNAGKECVEIEGYEIQKGLLGVTTHEQVERVPLLENTQDYAVLAEKLSEALETHPDAHGVLLSRHGLYTWGQSVTDARRHLEALEFLFEVEGRRVRAGGNE
jgi:methylthioribulose-1-phosphate dehydratase